MMMMRPRWASRIMGRTAREGHGAEHIGFENASQFLVGNILEIASENSAGVIDQAVECARTAGYGANSFTDRRVVCDVELQDVQLDVMPGSRGVQFTAPV